MHTFKSSFSFVDTYVEIAPRVGYTQYVPTYYMPERPQTSLFPVGEKAPKNVIDTSVYSLAAARF